MKSQLRTKYLIDLIGFTALQLLIPLLVSCNGFTEQGKNLPTSTATITTSSGIIEPITSTTVTNVMPIVPTQILKPDEITPTTMIVTEPAPFNLVTLDENRTTAQVWEFSSDQGEWSKLGQFTVPIDQPVNVVIPPEEINAMELFLKSEGIITPINELSPIAYIAETALSPTHKKLTILEIDRYTFDNFPYNSFGVWKIINFSLETNEADVLLQLPLEWGEATLDDLLWSPDSQFIILTQYKKNEANTLIVIDESKGTSQNLSSEIDLQGPLAWSPNSKMVAFSLSRWNIVADGGVIRFCTIASGVCDDIQMEGLWIYQSQFSNLDWSPDGERVAFAAVSGDPNSAVNLLPKLYFLNVETKDIHQIELDLAKVLKHPRWSPDGRYIAADYSEGVDTQSRVVIILDSTSERVINQLSLPAGWVWGSDSRTILRLNGQYPDQIEIINIFDGSQKLISLPDDLRGNMIGFSSVNQ